MAKENIEQSEHIVEIEQKICYFFMLDYDEVYSKCAKRNVVLARHFTIYLLHSQYGISWNKLAKRYKCSVRNIAYTCANMDFFVKHDKKYKNYYNCLMQYIKKGE